MNWPEACVYCLREGGERMNLDNYATLEACQRLLDAGIVLETDAWWILGFDGKYSLVHCATDVMRAVVKDRPGSVPAPSIAEVWRELPESQTIKDITYHKTMQVVKGVTYAYYELRGYTTRTIENTNPTDALIDLLIWTVRQRKEKK
jgi:hypothetical protein